MTKQHTPEPFGYFKAEPCGWTDCAETDEGAQPLYDQQAIDALAFAIQPPDRHQLQIDGKHPSPCAKFCEATAFLITERGLRKQLSKLTSERDELLTAAEAIEINAEECLDWDDCTAMLVPIGDYHKLMEAVASVKGGA